MKYMYEVFMIRDLANGKEIHSPHIIDLLNKHGCLYLLSQIKEYSPFNKAIVFANRMVLKERYLQCCQLFEDLTPLNYVVIKGAVLSNVIYGDPGYRFSNDIDILIPRSHLDYAKKILIKNGFQEGHVIYNKVLPYTRKESAFSLMYSHQACTFIKSFKYGAKTDFVNIDINLDIMWGESDLRPDIEKFVSHYENYGIFGITVKKLKKEYEFIALCLHHYKDMNSIFLLAERGVKLSLFCDIFYYITNVELNLYKTYEIARELGLHSYLYYCIFYTNKIFMSKKLELWLEEFSTLHCDQFINSYGLDENKRSVWKIPFYERLFSDSFQSDFKMQLNEEQLRTIKINEMFF